MDDINKTIDEAKKSQSDFLRVELETAFAFVNRAVTTQDLETRERNRQHARKGYDTIMRAFDSARLNPDDIDWLRPKAADLRARLEDLGEKF